MTAAPQTPDQPVAPQQPQTQILLEKFGFALVLLIIFIFYLALRWYFLGQMAPVRFSDSTSYIEQYRNGFAQGLFGRARCWGYPFFIWLTGFDLELVVGLQRLAGAVAWFAMALAAASLFRSGAARLIAFCGTLFCSLVLFALIWDAMLLSESFTNSFFIALTAAWIWFLGSKKGAGLRPLMLVTLLAIPFASLRDSNVMLLMINAVMSGLVLAFRFFRGCDARPSRRRGWAIGGMVALILAVCMGHIIEVKHCSRNWQSVGAVLSMRICATISGDLTMPHEKHIDWMVRNYGMPLEEAWSRLGKTVYMSPALPPVYDRWLKQTGASALTGFLLHHPGWVFDHFNSNYYYTDTKSGLIYLKPMDPWRKANLHLPINFQWFIHLTLDAMCDFEYFNTLLTAVAAVLGLAWLVCAWRNGIDGTSNVLGVLFWLVATGVFMLFMTIFGDVNEPLRHAITGMLALYVSLPILAAAVVEGGVAIIKRTAHARGGTLKG